VSGGEPPVQLLPDLDEMFSFSITQDVKPEGGKIKQIINS
jgi:hypothetical protein